MPKAYQLTINKISDWGAILEYLQSLTSINYMIACREFAPKTQKEHYHVYIQFKYSKLPHFCNILKLLKCKVHLFLNFEFYCND